MILIIIASKNMVAYKGGTYGRVHKTIQTRPDSLCRGVLGSGERNPRAELYVRKPDL